MKPYYEQDGITIYHSPCELVLPTLAASSCNLLATDPPYFRVKDEEWDRQWPSQRAFLIWLASLTGEWRRVLRANGSLYVFASPEMATAVERVVAKRFRVLNSIRWYKQDGWHQKTEKEALRAFLSPWESVVFAEQYGEAYEDASRALHKAVYAPIGRAVQKKREAASLSRGEIDAACSPSRKPTGLCYRWEEGACLPTLEQWVDLCRACGDGREYEDLRREYEDLRREYEDLRREFSLSPRSVWSDQWNFPTVQPYPGKHPCEKPVSMMEHIITTSTRPGDLVLDCFAGSGSTLLAAKLSGRRAIGIEREEKYCEIAVNRLAQGALFAGGAA
jgi:adenine-specific DNA-methyltransferase